MNKQVFLKKFQSNELIFDEIETKIILKFIFRSNHHLVDSNDD